MTFTAVAASTITQVSIQIVSGLTNIAGSSFSATAGQALHSSFALVSSNANVAIQIYLESLVGSQWKIVSQSASGHASNSLDFIAATSGTYRWRISISNSGSGAQPVTFTFNANGGNSMTFTAAPGNPSADPTASPPSHILTLNPTLSPTTRNPTTAPPTTLSPTHAITLAPTTAPPTTRNPTTAPPTTLSPTTAPPTTRNPTTAPPTTLSPTTAAPTLAHTSIQVAVGTTRFVGSAFSATAGQTLKSNFAFVINGASVVVQVFLESWDGSQWKVVEQSAPGQLSQSITFSVTSAGYYRWRLQTVNSGASVVQVSISFQAPGVSVLSFSSVSVLYQETFQILSGMSDYLGNGFYVSSGNSLHSDLIYGVSANVIVDLYLEQWDGAQWTIVARSVSVSGQILKSIDFVVSSSGYYRWVLHFSNSGASSTQFSISFQANGSGSLYFIASSDVYQSKVIVPAGGLDYFGPWFSSSVGQTLYSDLSFVPIGDSNLGVVAYLESFSGSQWSSVAQSSITQNLGIVGFTVTSAGYYRWRLHFTNPGNYIDQVMVTFQANGASLLSFVTSSDIFESSIQVSSGTSDYVTSRFWPVSGQTVFSDLSFSVSSSKISAILYLEIAAGEHWNIVAQSSLVQNLGSIQFLVPSTGSHVYRWRVQFISSESSSIQVSVYFEGINGHSLALTAAPVPAPTPSSATPSSNPTASLPSVSYKVDIPGGGMDYLGNVFSASVGQKLQADLKLVKDTAANSIGVALYLEYNAAGSQWTVVSQPASGQNGDSKSIDYTVSAAGSYRWRMHFINPSYYMEEVHVTFSSNVNNSTSFSVTSSSRLAMAASILQALEMPNWMIFASCMAAICALTAVATLKKRAKDSDQRRNACMNQDIMI
jgi:uncharacterized protein YegP (UPF0339 family)